MVWAIPGRYSEMVGKIILALLILAAVAVILWDRLRLRHILGVLDGMLDQAVRGPFQEVSFDESRLSALETKLAHYLSASVVSAGKLEEEKEKIKTLIGDLSHQIKTPVANLLLYAQLLGEQPLPEESRAYTAALESQAEKLQSLVEDLVKLSRLETGILTLHPCLAQLAPVLEDVMEQFSSKAVDKKITLHCASTEETAVFDPKWTEEALCNLLDNAIKYTPAGGHVAVEIVPYQLFCCVRVRDDGPGIPEEEQAKIFQRFYRAPVAHGVEGVGIGLYLVRQIAQDQGGYVKVDSQVGKGASFSLFLPRGE